MFPGALMAMVRPLSSLRAWMLLPGITYSPWVSGSMTDPSTIHPILVRLENEDGGLTSRWEDPKIEDKGRPRRRYYRLTEDGAERARTALAQATTSVTALGLRARSAGGLA